MAKKTLEQQKAFYEEKLAKINAKKREIERRERTKRLIKLGATLEKCYGAESIDADDLALFLEQRGEMIRQDWRNFFNDYTAEETMENTSESNYEIVTEAREVEDSSEEEKEKLMKRSFCDRCGKDVTDEPIFLNTVRNVGYRGEGVAEVNTEWNLELCEGCFNRYLKKYSKAKRAKASEEAK